MFTLVNSIGESIAEIEYDLTDVYYGTSLAFFEFVAAGSFSDVQIRVHGFA